MSLLEAAQAAEAKGLIMSQDSSSTAAENFKPSYSTLLSEVSEVATLNLSRQAF